MHFSNFVIRMSRGGGTTLNVEMASVSILAQDFTCVFTTTTTTAAAAAVLHLL